jgi:hypothetical protein
MKNDSFYAISQYFLNNRIPVLYQFLVLKNIFGIFVALVRSNVEILLTIAKCLRLYLHMARGIRTGLRGCHGNFHFLFCGLASLACLGVYVVAVHDCFSVHSTTDGVAILLYG